MLNGCILSDRLHGEIKTAGALLPFLLYNNTILLKQHRRPSYEAGAQSVITMLSITGC